MGATRCSWNSCSNKRDTMTWVVLERCVMVGFPKLIRTHCCIACLYSAVAGTKFLDKLEPCGLGERVQVVSCIAWRVLTSW